VITVHKLSNFWFHCSGGTIIGYIAIIANILRQESAVKLCRPIMKYMYRPNDFISELNKALNIHTIVYSQHHA